MVIGNSVIINLNILGVNKIDVGYCFLSNIMVLLYKCNGTDWSWIFRISLIFRIGNASATSALLLLPQKPLPITFSKTFWLSLSKVCFNGSAVMVFNPLGNSLLCFTNVDIITLCFRVCSKINYIMFMFKLSFVLDTETWTKFVTCKRNWRWIFYSFSSWFIDLFSFFSLIWYHKEMFTVMFSAVVWLLVCVASFSFETLLFGIGSFCLTFICLNTWFIMQLVFLKTDLIDQLCKTNSEHSRSIGPIAVI